jgi:hypothetical protein
VRLGKVNDIPIFERLGVGLGLERLRTVPSTYLSF